MTRNKLMFGFYSYAEQVTYALLDIVPPPMRELFFRCALGRLGRNCHIDYGTYFRYPWKISIGDGVWINRGCEFYASFKVKEAEILIGNHVAIGPEVSVFSAGHDYTSLDLEDTAGTVRINDYVWVGGRSIILPGVTLGEGCVIGAGAVVTKDVPSYCVAVGIPARVIGNRQTVTGKPQLAA